MNQLELLPPAAPCLTGQRRTLKIENLGDAWRGTVISAIRLKGRWLSNAGFQPGEKVTVSLLSPGRLELRLVGQPDANSEPGRSTAEPASADETFDFWVSDHGSVSLFHPQTHKARAWLKLHCPASDEHQYWCGALAIEARFVPDLLQHAAEDGLVISK